MFIKIKKAKYIGDYKLKVTFSDGSEGVVDLFDTLKGKIFESLKDKKIL